MLCELQTPLDSGNSWAHSYCKHLNREILGPNRNVENRALVLRLYKKCVMWLTLLKRADLAVLTCSLSTEREQVLNSLDHAQKSTKKPHIWATRISAIACFLGHKSMIFQRQKFCLMLFYNSSFNNSFQKCLLKKNGNKLIPIQNT